MRNVKNTPSAKRAARQDHRRLAREKLVDMRARLSAAVGARKGRLKELQEICRRQRLALRDSLRSTRERGLREIAERAKAEHLKVREDCRSQKAAAKKSGTDTVASARAAMAAARKLVAAKDRIATNQKVREEAFVRDHDVALANHVAHSAMLGLLGPLYERVRPTKKSGETRSEQILKYAEAHPEQVHAILHPAVDASIARTRAEIAAVERENAGATPMSLAMLTPYVLERVVDRAYVQVPRVPYGNAKVKSFTLATVNAKKPPTRPMKGLRSAPAPGVVRPPKGRKAITRPTVRPSRDRTTVPALPHGGTSALVPPARAANDFEATHGVGASRILPMSGSDQAGPEVVQLLRRKSSPETVKAPELGDTADIAKRIRQDIATAIKERRLPKATYSVRTSKYSMGSSITVEASKLPFPVINPDAYIVPNGWTHVTFDSANFRSRFTRAARDVEVTLNAIVDAYHWDQSDLASDYHHVRFHRDVRMTEDAREFKAMEAEKVASARAATGART